MELSVFLAKLLGFYFLICACVYLFRWKKIRSTVKELASSKSFLAVSAEISLLFGLAIAIDHSIWEYSWVGLITVLGYFLIARGILRLLFPDYVKTCVSKITDHGLLFIFLIMLIIGVFLIYSGFTCCNEYVNY